MRAKLISASKKRCQNEFGPQWTDITCSAPRVHQNSWTWKVSCAKRSINSWPKLWWNSRNLDYKKPSCYRRGSPVRTSIACPPLWSSCKHSRGSWEARLHISRSGTLDPPWTWGFWKESPRCLGRLSGWCSSRRCNLRTCWCPRVRRSCCTDRGHHILQFWSASTCMDMPLVLDALPLRKQWQQKAWYYVRCDITW